MKRIPRKRPSPALVVATLALFVALGGSSYAALTVGNSNIRNNSISGGKITNGTIGATAKLKARTITESRVKRRALRGPLFAQDSIGGNAVKEQALDASKLGQVKSAIAADSVGGLKVNRLERFVLESGQSKGIATVGPFAVSARCRVDGPAQVAEIIVQTNQNDSAIDGAQKDADFDIGEVVPLVASQGPAGTPTFDQESAGVVVAPDGTELLGHDLYVGTSVLGQAGKCVFGGAYATS